MSDEPYKDPEHAIPYLKLIRLGVPIWNKWIKGEISPPAIAEVLGVDNFPDPPHEFWPLEREEATVNFSYVDFTQRENATIYFSGAQFGNGIQFEGAIFGNGAQFERTNFGDWANFEKASFGRSANFQRAIFGFKTKFNSSSFDEYTNFQEAVFGELATFRKARFGYSANFQGASFGDGADFSGASPTDVLNQLRAQAEQDAVAEEAREIWIKERLEESKHNTFAHISFMRSIFLGDVDFSNRVFKGFANFSAASFNLPPIFESCQGMERLDVAGAKFLSNWTTNSNVPTRLRILRKQMEDIKAHDVERDLFIAERKAELGVFFKSAFGKLQPTVSLLLFMKALGASSLLLLFWLLSDCGRSAKRPLGWFVAKLAWFYYAYWLFIVPTPSRFEEDIFSFTLGHALPFATGLSPVQVEVMKRLFGEKLDQMPLSIELLSIAQSLIGALLLFLFLQAIRNHFRLR